MIPQPTKSNVKPRYVCDMRIGFDPTQSPYYKLVYATIIGDGDDDDDDDVVSIQMQTYSSEKCSWSAVCIEPFSGKCFPGFGSGIYWNDAIHWLTRIRASHYKIGIANKTVVLTKIQLPVTLDTLCCHRLFESRGSLLLLGKDSTDFHLLYVYEMRNEHSEWSFKYFINLEDNMRCLYTNWMLGEGVPCIALGEREDDSFMVIGTSAKIFQYNIGLKTYRDLSDPDLLFHYDSFLFTASFAGV